MVSRRLGLGLRSAGEERAKEFLFERERDGECRGDEEVGLPAAPRAPRGGAGMG